MNPEFSFETQMNGLKLSYFGFIIEDLAPRKME